MQKAKNKPVESGREETPRNWLKNFKLTYSTNVL
jgi:hypothetical protein